jgi:hypothetical protein
MQPPPVKLVRWFDHQASDLVEVFPNAEGEFVQVWSGPRGESGRYVTLSYQRTPVGPTAIESRVCLEGTTWAAFSTTGPRRNFYYPGDNHDHRYEEILPRGGLLVDDPREGLAIRSVFTEGFDWKLWVPKGKELGDRAVLVRQNEGEPWYVTYYQDSSNGSSILRLVVEHLGHELQRAIEPDPVT